MLFTGPSLAPSSERAQFSDTDDFTSPPNLAPQPNVLPSNYRADDEIGELGELESDEAYNSEQNKNRATMAGFALGSVCLVGLAGFVYNKKKYSKSKADYELNLVCYGHLHLFLSHLCPPLFSESFSSTSQIDALSLSLSLSLSKEIMASNRGHGGIQQLLAAEQEAQHIVNAARSAKNARLKEAKDEAEREIAEYRAHVEAEFQKKVQASSGDSGANVKRLEYETAEKINHLSTEGSRISNDVVQMLLKQVTTYVADDECDEEDDREEYVVDGGVLVDVAIGVDDVGDEEDEDFRDSYYEQSEDEDDNKFHRFIAPEDTEEQFMTCFACLNLS
ncbi:hypothetical protein DVH24_001518 [Malus domestica]|uniref:V-type proton ATPase subunit G n=1 Tax=Malus domestica TaxID=3750 RepID=A0A498K4T7_MALDO|nr:hypothetical protein DVH24_001518 [Malus domestica]